MRYPLALAYSLLFVGSSFSQGSIPALARSVSDNPQAGPAQHIALRHQLAGVPFTRFGLRGLRHHPSLSHGFNLQAASASPYPVYNVPSSIASDCSRPVEKDIMAWMATVPDDSTLRFKRNGCYGEDGEIDVNDRQSLTIDGNGSTFKTLTVGTYNRSNWRIQSGGNITLENMTARGANPQAGTGVAAYYHPLEWQHAYAFDGTQTATLANVQGYDVYGDFVETEPDWRIGVSSPPVRNLTVMNSHFDGSGRQGVALTDVDGFVLENSYISDVRWVAIDVEMDVPQEVARNIKILNNTFGSIRFSVLANQGAGSSPNVGSLEMKNNVEVGPLVSCDPPVQVYPPAGLYRSTYTISHNRFLTMGNGFVFDQTDQLSLSGNTVTFSNPGGCTGHTGVVLSDSHVVTLTNNTFTGANAAVSADSSSSGLELLNNAL